MIILIIMLTVLLLCMCYLLFLSMKRINQYETYLSHIFNVVQFTSQKIKQVDTSGHYESDDETGAFFEQLKSLQKLLDELFETQKENNGQKKEKNVF